MFHKSIWKIIVLSCLLMRLANGDSNPCTCPKDQDTLHTRIDYKIRTLQVNYAAVTQSSQEKVTLPMGSYLKSRNFMIASTLIDWETTKTTSPFEINADFALSPFDDDENADFTFQNSCESCCANSPFKANMQFSKSTVYGAIVNFGGDAENIPVPEIVKVQSVCTQNIKEVKSQDYRMCIDSIKFNIYAQDYVSATLLSPIELLFVDVKKLDSFKWELVGTVTNAAKTWSKTYDPIPMEQALKNFTIDDLSPGTVYYYTFQVFAVGSKHDPISSNVVYHILTSGIPIPTLTAFGDSLMIALPGHDMWSLQYNVSDFSNPTRPLRVFRADQVVVGPKVLSDGIKVEGLKPGTNYSVEYKLFRTAYPNTLYPGRLFVTTLCSCGVSESDAPVIVNDRVRQHNGFVYFVFNGYSACGSAYTFTRQKLLANGTFSVPEVFTSNYHFYQDMECPTLYSPKQDAADDLSRSNLDVGATYRYNIRAVANQYQGQVASVDHIVRWESSVAGFVGLSESNGNLPVADVTVHWELLNLDGTTRINGTTISGIDGKYEIDFNLQVNFDKDEAYPLRLQFSKFTKVNETYSMKHQILCDKGTTICTDQPTTVYLKHLQFDTPVAAIDSTVVPVTGKVYMASTKLDDRKKPWGQEGCPMNGVKVCLIDMAPDDSQGSELSCTDTDTEGRYNLPGVLGSFVSIRVTYKSHNFFYVPASKPLNIKDGFLIEAGQNYEMNHFEDRTLAPLAIDLVGGLCNISLGKASVRYKVEGCPWPGQLIQMTTPSQNFRLPANNLVVSVENIVQHPSAKIDPINIDLSYVPMDENTKALQKKRLTSGADLLQGDTSTARSIRFQYNGKSQLRAFFDKNLNGNCDSVKAYDGDTQVQTVSKPIVLRSEDLVHVKIFISQDFGNDKVCNVVDPSTTITVYNGLGLAAGDPSDDKYKEKIPEPIREYMETCNSGCTMNISNIGSSSVVEFDFVTGRPNTVSPYTKTMKITASDNTQLVLTVILDGQYKISDDFTVGLPTYEPIMILRDPPGGGSSSFYQNIETTLRIDNIANQEYSGLDRDTNAAVGMNLDQGICAMMFSTGTCQSTFKSKVKIGYKGRSSSQSIDHMLRKMKQGGFTVTWSYATSTNPFTVGGSSDIYVIPSLNVKYSLTDILTWDSAYCRVGKTRKNTFNLESPENAPALAFVSEYEIKKVEIDTLQSLAVDLKKQLKNCTVTNNCDEIQAKLTAANDGIKGWEAALKKNEWTKQQAITNTSNLVKPQEWFQKSVFPSMKGGSKLNITNMNVNSGFVSSRLASKAELRPFYQNKSVSDPKSINTIKFSGGGTAVSYSLTQNQLIERIGQSGQPDENRVQNIYWGLYQANDNTILSGLLESDLNLGNATSLSASHLETNTDGSTTNVGFTLADPNIGDVFDVDVYLDPIYGSFVFHTRGGHSMCPTEPGTVARAVPKLEVAQRPSPTVLASEPMYFLLKLKNEGDYASPFTLNFDYRTTVDSALSFYPRLPLAIERVDPGETVEVMLSVTRGKLYDHAPVTVIAEVGCEAGLDVDLDAVGGARKATAQLYNIQNAAKKNMLSFAKPCPSVFLADQVQLDQYFAVTTSRNTDSTVKVSVRNPASSVMSFYEATNDNTTRLQHVELRYRRKGDIMWEYGQHEVDGKMTRIDFAVANLEDAYGYASVKWNMENLPDGEYEMFVQSVCDTIPNAPEQFNHYATEILDGVVDRSAPKIFGMPIPQNVLQAGEDIEVQFNEMIDCNVPFLFDVTIEVVETGQIFTNENLLVVCEYRFISIQFDQTNTDVESLIDKRIIMKLFGVSDTNGNQIEHEIVNNLTIVPWKNKSSSQRRRLAEHNGEGDLTPRPKVINPSLNDEMDRKFEVHLENTERLLMESLNEELQSHSNNRMFSITVSMMALVASIVFASWSYAILSVQSFDVEDHLPL